MSAVGLFVRIGGHQKGKVNVAQTEESIREALAQLIDPATGRDYVASGEVKTVNLEGGKVSVGIELGYPAASVAVLRDTIVNQAYSVRVGDELGRLRVVEITPGQVVLVLSEFGSERQVVLRQRRRQEGTP